MSSLFEQTYNPDVLSCLANLSNDEVFTPPEVANQMLDLLPPEIWADPDVKILDPACKTGVFLREAAKRMIEAQLPGYAKRVDAINRKKREGIELSEGDEGYLAYLQEVVDHIFKEQLYGIAITELTSLMSRRSVYCSKYPNSKYSVARFAEPDVEGNIRFKSCEHKWYAGRCKYCGASEKQFNEGKRKGLETHAYELIHTENPEELLNMKFDVIIGNPPYQLSDGGGEGASAIPLYHRFIEQAIKLNPRFLTMIVPARWYSGGKGLDEFRNEMLHDQRLSVIHDFPETDLCFPGINIRGGVCYFLWERDHKGQTKVVNHSSQHEPDEAVRPLLESGATTFIRYNRAVSILRKVASHSEETYDNRVMARNPFGIPSNFDEFKKEPQSESDLILYRSRRGSTTDKVVYVGDEYVQKGHELIERVKVLVSKASPGGDEYPHAVFSTPLVAPPHSVCTETYLVVDTPNTLEEANNLLAYMSTRFFRFLVSLIKNTQNIAKGCFAFVPVQDLTIAWTDDLLYEKYGLDSLEIAFIESMIKPMELGDLDG